SGDEEAEGGGSEGGGSAGGEESSEGGSAGGEESSDAGAAGGEGDADAGANEGAEDAENGSPPPEGSDGEGTGSDVPPNPEDMQEPDLDEPPPPPPPASSEPPPPIPLAVVLIGDDHEPPGERWYLRSEVREALEGDHFVIDLEAELVPTPVPDEVRTDCPITPLHAEVTGSVSLLASAEFAFAPVEPCRLAHRDNPQPGRFNDSWEFTAAMPTLGFSEILAKRGKALLPPEPDAAEDAEADAEPPPPRVLPVRPPEHFATLPPELQDVWSEKAAELLVGIDEDIANHPLGPALVTREWVEKAWTVLEVPREDASLAELVLGDAPTGTVMHGAEAVAMVARARGIPARVARGYAPPAEARNGSSLVVYHHDAQAWAEIWVAEVGWVPVSASPQPPFSVVSAPPPDLELARQLVEEARGGWDQPYEPVRLSDLFHLLPQLTLPSRETMLRALTVLLAGLLGLIWARKAWAMSRTRWSAHYIRAAHHTALERLTEVGVRRNIGETSTSFARRMETEVPSLAQLSAWHVAAKMSRHAYAEPPTRADVLNTLHAFTRELQSEVPFWRRALGLLDPTSSFRVR
ncbi:MAG: transglutaminase-like domain-containing protein, partial [Myxococcota bacterium]